MSDSNNGCDIMPKLIVLFFGAEGPAVTLAEAAAEGAKRVRFTEVDLRIGAPHQAATERRHRRLESPAQIFEYDGIVLVSESAGEVPHALSTLLDDLEGSASGALSNTVFGIGGGESAVLAGRVLRLGGILVGEPPGLADPEARAARLGERVATMVGWVRHALSHAQEPGPREPRDGHHDHHHDSAKHRP